MNPLKARFLIEKLIEEHGPDCIETGHKLIVRDGKPLLVDNATKQLTTDKAVCDVGKAGMRQGFSMSLWTEMGEALSETMNV